jgi:hypothetical protein
MAFAELRLPKIVTRTRNKRVSHTLVPSMTNAIGNGHHDQGVSMQSGSQTGLKRRVRRRDAKKGAGLRFFGTLRPLRSRAKTVAQRFDKIGYRTIKTIPGFWTLTSTSMSLLLSKARPNTPVK